MSLQIWLPLNGDLHNQGLRGNLTVTNSGATVDNSGKIGKCYAFSGSQYAKITNVTTIPTNSWSLAAWVYPMADSSSGHQYILGMNTSTSTDFLGELCYYINKFSVRTGGTTYSASSTSALNTWYHIAATYNGTTLKLYVNGVQAGSWNSPTAPVASTTVYICTRGGITGNFQGKLNDVRIYDHCLSPKEVEEIAKGLVLHYKLDEPNNNLGNTSADYHNKYHGQSATANAWGGDTGTVTWYHYGGYNNLPYKVYHKTATGSGGIHSKTDNDINIEANTTYTMSCWIKASRAFSASNYSFCINRGSDNFYITYGSNFDITTEWKFFKKTFTTGSSDNGLYGEMSIVYDDGIADYYIYYSGFKIEKGSDATAWVPPNYNTRATIYDSSGYSHNGTIVGSLTAAAGGPRYEIATQFPGSAYSKCTSPSTEAQTISVWAKWNSIPSGQSIIYVDYKSKTGLGLMSTGILCSSCGLNSYTFNKATIMANTWYHFVVVCPNGSANATRQLYINGIEQTATSNATNWSCTIDELQVGKRSTTSDGFNGQLSDFRIYATALTAAQIKELYNTSMSIDSNGNVYARELVEL